MAGMNAELPYVDQHAIRLSAPRKQAWAALNLYVERSLVGAEGSLLTKVLGTEPRAGFEVSETVPEERLTLVGRHRFSRYMLVFELGDTADGATELRATTYAAFPGVHGRVYRALVIGTGLHVVATNQLLRGIRRQTQLA
jgi:hypothetical protein